MHYAHWLGRLAWMFRCIESEQKREASRQTDSVRLGHVGACGHVGAMMRGAQKGATDRTISKEAPLKDKERAQYCPWAFMCMAPGPITIIRILPRLSDLRQRAKDEEETKNQAEEIKRKDGDAKSGGDSQSSIAPTPPFMTSSTKLSAQLNEVSSPQSPRRERQARCSGSVAPVALT